MSLWCIDVRNSTMVKYPSGSAGHLRGADCGSAHIRSSVLALVVRSKRGDSIIQMIFGWFNSSASRQS